MNISYQKKKILWKKAINGHHPNGDKDPELVSNYCPFCLLCRFKEVYRGHRERPDPKLCVRQQYSFIYQLGFRQKTGAVQQVDLFLNQVEKYRRPRTQVEAALLDVEKAYNKI